MLRSQMTLTISQMFRSDGNLSLLSTSQLFVRDRVPTPLAKISLARVPYPLTYCGGNRSYASHDASAHSIRSRHHCSNMEPLPLTPFLRLTILQVVPSSVVGTQMAASQQSDSSENGYRGGERRATVSQKDLRQVDSVGVATLLQRLFLPRIQDVLRRKPHLEA